MLVEEYIQLFSFIPALLGNTVIILKKQAALFYVINKHKGNPVNEIVFIFDFQIYIL